MEFHISKVEANNLRFLSLLMIFVVMKILFPL